MKESFWGYAFIILGILAIGVIWFVSNVTRTDQHNYNLLKETVEASMLDASDGVKMDEKIFVETFLRRFAENADLSNTYKIEIFDINENPPKVSIRVSSAKSTNVTGETYDFQITNNIDAILETPY